MYMVAGRDAWSHAYQPGEIKNITPKQATDYLVSRSIAKTDAQELVKVCMSFVLLCIAPNVPSCYFSWSRCFETCWIAFGDDSCKWKIDKPRQIKTLLS